MFARRSILRRRRRRRQRLLWIRGMRIILVQKTICLFNRFITRRLHLQSRSKREREIPTLTHTLAQQFFFFFSIAVPINKTFKIFISLRLLSKSLPLHDILSFSQCGAEKNRCQGHVMCERINSESNFQFISHINITLCESYQSIFR